MQLILLNFAHPLSPAQIEQAAVLSGQPVERVIDLPVQFDPAQPFEAQLKELMERLPLDAQQLQTVPLVVNLPSLNFIAALLLAELHGRMGYFPPVLRLAPAPGSLPPRYEVSEILNLQAVRDAARRSRYDQRT
jgi:hypothetical protein